MNSQKSSHRGQLANLLADLLFLLIDKRWTQQELARELNVSARTIKRCLDAIGQKHNISEEPEGRFMYYRFNRPHHAQPHFSAGELATLILAQDAIAATGLTGINSPFARHARSMLAKVRAYLPTSLNERLDAMARVYGSATQPVKDFTPHADKIDQLVNAAIEGRRLRMRYHGLSKNEISERKFDPYVVYFDPDGATLKVIGHDHKSNSTRPFSIDHISSLTDTPDRFIPPDFNLHEYLTENCFNGIHGEPVTVRLRAYGITARIFAEREFHPSQREIARTENTATSKESITIEMRVARGRGLERFILSWAPEIEVLAPLELRQKIAELHQQSFNQHAPTDGAK